MPFGAGSLGSQLEALGFGNRWIAAPVDVLAVGGAFDRHLLASDFAFARQDQPRIVLARALLVLRVALAVHLGEDQLALVVQAVANGPVAQPVVEEHIFLGGAGIEISLGRFDNDATLGRPVIRFVGRRTLASSEFPNFVKNRITFSGLIK